MSTAIIAARGAAATAVFAPSAISSASAASSASASAVTGNDLIAPCFALIAGAVELAGKLLDFGGGLLFEQHKSPARLRTTVQ